MLTCGLIFHSSTFVKTTTTKNGLKSFTLSYGKSAMEEALHDIVLGG
jgi:hypothetical protein